MINSIRRWVKREFYRIKYRSQHVIIERGCNLKGIHVAFEGYNKIGQNTTFSGAVGYGTYIGSNCSINGIVGKYCSLSNNIRTISYTHPSKVFVSTHPSFYSTAKQSGFTFVTEDKFNEYLYADKEKHTVIIGNDVWIGEGVTILGGVRIGDGAIVAMGATVVKDVKPYTIVGGVPARVINKRFSDEDIVFLQKLQWWNKDMDWISSHSQYFENIELLKEHVPSKEE